jgi:hypothetical protein
METPKYAQPETKFTPREMPIASGAPPEQRFVEERTLSRMTRHSTVWVIDLFEMGDRAAEVFEESGKKFVLNRRASKVAAGRRPGANRVGRLEESLYWLFSAAVLGYLLLEIIGH